MNSRERILEALSHKVTDKLPVDFGSSLTTGIHVSQVYKIRQYYGLDEPGTPVKIIDPYQMLGEIKDDLKDIIGIDVAPLDTPQTIFGFRRENWKEWKLDDKIPVLVPGLFNTEKNDDGSLYQYPQGDKNYSPSGKMPSGGFYFDSIIRKKNIDEDINPGDNLEEFNILSEDDLSLLKKEVINIYNYSVLGTFANSSFGDVAFVPGPMLKEPKGIRDIEEWYISLATRRDYIKKIFEGQLEIALENYREVNKAIGEKIDIVYISGTDFGMQQSLFMSKYDYRELFKPFHKRINDWIHENTNWKTFMHSCGAIFDLIPDFIEAGFDILNPVQISATEMDPLKLKKSFGDYITFWGGGVDTQKVLPMGSPDEVRKQAREMIEIFNQGGGFVFNAVHNIQANIPIENIIALIEIIQEYR